MRVKPFSGYLDYFPTGYRGTLIDLEQLFKADFPVMPYIFENYSAGLIPIKQDGKELFDVQELIGVSRLYSIPNEGFISKKPISAAEILNIETVDGKKTYETKISCVHVAAAFMPSEDRRRCSGQVVFICPFCGCIHFHGASGERFGDGDGTRVPHCTCDNPAYYRLNTQKFERLLDSNWQFNLVETEDFMRAGDFPKYFAKHLANRRKG